MDVPTILMSLEEREKWHRRLVLLRRSLLEVRSRRRHLERQLKTLKRELARVGHGAVPNFRTMRSRAAGADTGSPPGPITSR
ncbi:MAG: hypothetical protein ACYDFT_00990 [Thermoplasmata archaeon]